MTIFFLFFFLISGFNLGKNVYIFGVDNSSSTHADNKKKHFNSW